MKFLGGIWGALPHVPPKNFCKTIYEWKWNKTQSQGPPFDFSTNLSNPPPQKKIFAKKNSYYMALQLQFIEFCWNVIFILLNFIEFAFINLN